MDNIYEIPPKGVDMTLADWSFPDAFKDEVIHPLRQLDWYRYPAADAASGKQAIGHRFDVDPDNVLLTNGCTEALDLVARWASQSNATMLLPSPGYFAYGQIMKNNNVYIENYDPSKLCDAIPSKGNHLLICNPNNPTGDWYHPDQLSKINDDDNTQVIIDSTYAFFREDYQDHLFKDYLHRGFINLISFSKAFGVAGLRLGAIIAPCSLIEQILAIRPRYVLDFAQIIAIKTLMNEQWYRYASNEWRSIRQEALEMKSFLESIPGLNVYPQTANFVSFLNRSAEGKEILPYSLLEELPCKIWNSSLVRLTIRRDLKYHIRSKILEYLKTLPRGCIEGKPPAKRAV